MRTNIYLNSYVALASYSMYTCDSGSGCVYDHEVGVIGCKVLFPGTARSVFTGCEASTAHVQYLGHQTGGLNSGSDLTENPLETVNISEPLSPPSPTTSEPAESRSIGNMYAAIVAVLGVVFLLLGATAIWLYRSQRYMKRAMKVENGAASDTKAPTEISSYHQGTFSLSMREKLGAAGLLAVFLPLPLEIASLGFLSTFWTTPTQPTNETLRGWIINGKLPTIIAILSLVLRLSKGAQTALAVAMIASIALEGFRVSIEDIPALMIQRSNSAASTEILLLFLRKAFAKGRPRQISFLVPLLLLAILSYATEFTSTLLLSDLGSKFVRGSNATEPFPMGFDEISYQQRGDGNDDVNYAGAPPAIFPLFAELGNGTSRSDFIDYTGLSLRAFLPISSLSDRQSLRNFSGYATIINTTTICVRPHVLDFSVASSNENPQLTVVKVVVDYPLLKTELGSNGFDAAAFFDRRVGNNSKFNQFSKLQGSSSLGGNFSCTIPTSTLSVYGTNQGTPTFLCSLGGIRAFAFVNLTGFINPDNITKENDWWNVSNLTELSVDEVGSWSMLTYKRVRMAWSISLCSTVIEPQFQEVTIWSESPLIETYLITNNVTKALDTANLLQWLDASNKTSSYQERGVQSLGRITNLAGVQPRIGILPINRPLGGNPLGPYYQDGKMTYWLCERCPEKFSNGPAYFHPVYTRILQDSLAETGQPSKALQAFWTLIYQAYYYDNLLFFNVFSNSTYTSWSMVLAPVQWRGFIVVIVLTITHLLLVYGTCAHFLYWTKFSKLHDPWLAYTQTCRGAFADALEDVTLRGIKNPAKMLRKQGRSEDIVGLDVDVLGRAVGVRKRNPKLSDANLGNSDSE
ncbi:hypothetical protein F5Y19DRAFT_483128 [Xylariaceae sp. FL1651]|nr:hypothetical protein F5Y19DRAFT_483128 [Xylariaceae sp. FL1651]